MRIAVVGAGGRTGSEVMRRAAARGHHVVAVVRHPANVAELAHQCSVARADIRDPEALLRALDGCDGVISAVGAGTRDPRGAYSGGATALLKAMGGAGVKRVVVTSAVPVGDRAEQSWWSRKALMPLLDVFFGRSYRDMALMEERLRAGGVDWVSIRPPRLVGAKTKNRYRISERPLSGASAITRGGLADALIDALETCDPQGHIVYVAD